MPYVTHLQPPARDSRLRRRARGPCSHNERLKPGGARPDCSTTMKLQRPAASLRLAAALEQRAQPACSLRDAVGLAQHVERVDGVAEAPVMVGVLASTAADSDGDVVYADTSFPAGSFTVIDTGRASAARSASPSDTVYVYEYVPSL